METKSYYEIINKTKTQDIADIANIGINMAGKYKRGANLPTLETAIDFEEKLDIPVRAWLYVHNQYKATQATH